MKQIQIRMVVTLLLTIHFTQAIAQKVTTITPEPYSLVRFRSSSVKDTYSLFIKKPKGYDKEPSRKYTTIYLLDANVYFEIVASMVDKYNEMGIMAPVILVGIGYQDFEQMENLRTRDYLYPKALPEYEMRKSGGGDKFQNFIQGELIPYIDSTYRAKADNRVLMGHSFGGYFCLYALLQNMVKQDNIFRSYIAASPALQYNDKHLLDLLSQRAEGFTVPKFVYTSMGEAEDGENGEQKENITAIFTSFNQQMTQKAFKNIKYKGEVYSNFKHLETAVAS
ncbi:MAG: alpha/beta hydrolase, partial [Ferruginibacter sp.]|nr:alpha/beta hydrolase [Cytophagales bacterium]